MSASALAVMVSPTVDSTQSPPPLSFHSPRSSNGPSAPNSAPAPARSAQASRDPALGSKRLPDPPPYDFPAFDFESNFDASLRLPPVDVTPESDENSTRDPSVNTPGGFEPRSNRMGRAKSLLGRPQSWMPSSKTSPDFGDSRRDVENVAAGGFEDAHQKSPERPKTSSSSFTSFAKRSWRTPSRSSSPVPDSADSSKSKPPDPAPRLGRSSTTKSINQLKAASRKSLTLSTADTSEGNKSSDSLTKIGAYWTKMKRPQNAMGKGKALGAVDSPSSSTASIGPPSTDTRPSHTSERSYSTAPEDTVATPKPLLYRDTLWSIFKGLDADFSKFQSKPMRERTIIIKTTLVPFLRKYASHPSNTGLHHEDLERRANILNKWWTTLLDMIAGKWEAQVPGTERPNVFEAITMIMMRPEWRATTPSCAALADVDSTKHLSKGNSSSAESLGSTDSDYFAQSAQHNVRTMFVTNLVVQANFVIDKLNQRSAPLSLVNFAGKACAYAMFFAPGIGSMLMRLWGLSTDTMRRVADEFSLPRYDRVGSESITSHFPPSMAEFSWTSAKTMNDMLKRPASTPLAVSRIPWHGQWVSRWRGRDTDLFFVFCKYFFVLLEEFLPPGLSLTEKAKAPGFILVNSQLLAVLDSTVHRQAAFDSAMGPPLADTMQGADASLMALPVPQNNNVMKGMNENRLVMLLRDFLSASCVQFPDARDTFAESFGRIMKATAKRTSQFDHNACFTLCDFLEESLAAYHDFVDPLRPGLAYVDWPFWFEVWQRIIESNNTMSEIRALSLIFSAWEAVAADQERKKKLCQEWLLKEETFDRFFNHWCPMIRAYYMRLLCWRVCRDTGDATALDIDIFICVSSRLRNTWARYLWHKEAAEMAGQFPPSTAPCFPAPGKRFLIMRHEVAQPQPGLALGFDHFSSSPMAEAQSAGPAAIFDAYPQPDTEVVNPKKKWNLFGKVLSFTGGSTMAQDLEALRRDTEARAKLAQSSESFADDGGAGSDSDSMGSSPTFEPMQYVFRFTLQWNGANTITPPNRILSRPRLPAPAQSLVSPRDRNQPQLPAAGRPPATRAISGSSHAGLVESAKNAGLVAAQDEGRLDPGSGDSDGTPRLSGLTPALPPADAITQPLKPTGTYEITVKYAGRALAEWGLVVGECNGFVDRRRDEGIDGLSDVEVPMLGVDGFRKIG